MSDTILTTANTTVSTIQPKLSVVFNAGDTWALRITKDGIEGNPDVPTDDAARAVIEALKPYLRALRPPTDPEPSSHTSEDA